IRTTSLSSWATYASRSKNVSNALAAFALGAVDSRSGKPSCFMPSLRRFTRQKVEKPEVSRTDSLRAAYDAGYPPHETCSADRRDRVLALGSTYYRSIWLPNALTLWRSEAGLHARQASSGLPARL